MTIMVTTNQKPIIDTQKIKRKQPKHDTKENNQTKREQTRGRKEQRTKEKKMRKQLPKQK